jgi:hypothetical protein
MEFGSSVLAIPKSGQIGTIVLNIWYERLFYGMFWQQIIQIE